jgi:hypothetical protein
MYHHPSLYPFSFSSRCSLFLYLAECMTLTVPRHNHLLLPKQSGCCCFRLLLWKAGRQTGNEVNSSPRSLARCRYCAASGTSVTCNMPGELYKPKLLRFALLPGRQH